MSKLDDVPSAMVKDVFELSAEGINIQEYWTARMDLADDDLRTFLYDHVATSVKISRTFGLSLPEILMQIATQFFTMGFIWGRKEEYLD